MLTRPTLTTTALLAACACAVALLLTFAGNRPAGTRFPLAVTCAGEAIGYGCRP